MNKRLIVLSVCLLLFISGNSHSQSIIGLWQEETHEVGTGYLATYQFYKDGNFKYNSNQFDGLQRVVSIAGKYYVQKDSILFDVLYTIEMSGGHIVRSEMLTLNDSWAFENSKMDTLFYERRSIQKATLKIIEGDLSNPFIEIDSKCFFLLNKDPAIY